jgi:hypothetical protein
MFLLSLIAALAGTPLREAEAAHDLACSLAELGGGDIIEEVDGGVGDDSGATIKSDGPHASMLLTSGDALPPPVILTVLPGDSHDRAGTSRSAQHTPSSPRRHALLQCFLF